MDRARRRGARRHRAGVVARGVQAVSELEPDARVAPVLGGGAAQHLDRSRGIAAAIVQAAIEIELGGVGDLRFADRQIANHEEREERYQRSPKASAAAGAPLA